MMTVGGRPPARWGVLPPLAVWGEPPNEPDPEAELMLLKGDCPAMPCSCPCAPTLLGGRGLFRVSLRFDAEDEGVIVGDWLEASLDPVLLGEAVPSLESFFFDDLLESFPRDSCQVACVSRSPVKVDSSGCM